MSIYISRPVFSELFVSISQNEFKLGKMMVLIQNILWLRLLNYTRSINDVYIRNESQFLFYIESSLARDMQEMVCYQ